MAFGSPMPERIGRYEILLQIARGGMATVFLARAEGHGGFDRYVALKLTADHLRDDPEFAQHLVDEAKLVAHLRHQNVVPVLDVGEHDGGAVFLVMEYVPGDSLGGLFKLAKKYGRELHPRIGLRILVDALAGLHAAHEHCDEDGKHLRLVHRDFSPQNILVGTDGIARLTDFGIAKAASRASVTVAGTMKGKVSYASPEQARGKDLDRRCDVWAGGVMAWEIFAQRKLFPSNERTLLDVVKGPPPRIRSLVPNVPPEIDDAIARALGFEVDARTPTAQAFARELGTAAAAYDLLASNEEVAEFVRHMVAPILEERKAAIAEARSRRSGARTPSQPEVATAPLPSLPEMPMTDDGGTAVMLGAPVRPPPLVDDRRPPPSFDAWSPASTTPAGVEQAPPPAPPMIETPKERVQRLFREKPAIVIGGAAGFAGLMLVLALVIAFAGSGSSSSSSSSEKKQAKTTASASASALAAFVPPVDSVRAPATPSGTTTNTPPATPQLGEGEPLPPQLEVVANAPVARLALTSRTVEMEVPAKNVAIELTPEESGAAVAVTATSIDGRSGQAVWNPGDAEVTIAFGDAPPPRHDKPRPRPGPRPRR
ncbi:MAG: serine/threonine protein kinase [Labilithrix sp.]|nr:serine/threonine protein kinase [Labilithrix sp.]MCW5813781.1 serine/threonine protein kinase [Labilithrix sp.]